MNFHYSNIVSLDNKGILLRKKHDEVFIDFELCVKNSENRFLKNGKCIAIRDITIGSFDFFTGKDSATRIIFRSILFNAILTRKFQSFQKEIIRLGYSTFDMS